MSAATGRGAGLHWGSPTFPASTPRPRSLLNRGHLSPFAGERGNRRVPALGPQRGDTRWDRTGAPVRPQARVRTSHRSVNAPHPADHRWSLGHGRKRTPGLWRVSRVTAAPDPCVLRRARCPPHASETPGAGPGHSLRTGDSRGRGARGLPLSRLLTRGCRLGSDAHPRPTANADRPSDARAPP